MALPPALLTQHRRAIDSLSTVARRELVGLWSTVNLQDARSATTTLLRATPPMVDRFGDIAGALGADFYDEARAASGSRGRHRAVVVAAPPTAQVEVLVRWAVTPLWSLNPEPAVALSRLAGGFDRLVLKPERETIINAAHRDPARVGYAREPRADACDFCLMLGSRGAVYSDSTALFRADGKRFHDNCYCRSVPVFDPGDLPDINRQLAEEWRRVTAGARNSDEMRELWRSAVNDGALDLAGLAS